MKVLPPALLVLALALAACDDPAAPLPGVPADTSIAGDWRMQSFNQIAVPGAYAEYWDVPVGDRIVHHAVIRLDSATARMSADGRYQRRYCFSELQEELLTFRYCWGDHGVYEVTGSDPRAIALTSEWIQNLATAGTITGPGQLALMEAIWIGEELVPTVWVKR